ncbi:HEPN domain-containing protein [Thermofilum pendens]|uniref:HEPN domain-containing protein n=1 Tax=Thermofilum pendens (strain DSM 2475 / Hrk 5) TaxID=368408 RepID=A1RYW9_THEPD|nr:HEPN domain-containing protein [Thermofilum pendens]ABL78399.1 conserved hypothetical protein [Thermofilum pendens Hrk 5]
MINPVSEVRYRYRLAVEHLERAERLFSLGDWAGVVAYSQLAVENFAKAVVAVFEVPTWSYDPSNQLRSLLDAVPLEARREAEELANIARDLAPEHGRTSYGEPSAGLVPSDIYKREHAVEALEKGRRARELAGKVLGAMGIAP